MENKESRRIFRSMREVEEVYYPKRVEQGRVEIMDAEEFGIELADRSIRLFREALVAGDTTT